VQLNIFCCLSKIRTGYFVNMHTAIPGRRFVQISLSLFILLMIQDTRSERSRETEYYPAETMIFSLEALLNVTTLPL
jgi:hypothetical protein